MPPPAQPLPMIPGAGSIPVSTLCKMMDELSRLTLPHSPPSTSCLPAPPYHLLGFGSFTAESTGLSSGQVLGEMAVEHPEAARVHLANSHFCLVPWAKRNGLPRKHVQKSLASLASHSNPQRVPRVLCLQGSTVSSLLCTPVRQVIQGSPQCILSICWVGHSGNGKRDK